MKSNKSEFINITYGELGDYIGRKASVTVSKEWFDLICGIVESKKECTKCNEILPLDSFNNDKRRKFGKRSQCKSCYKEGDRERKGVDKEDQPKIEFVVTNFND